MVVVAVVMGMSALTVALAPPPAPRKPVAPTAAGSGGTPAPPAAERLSAEEEGQVLDVEVGTAVRIEVESVRPVQIQLGAGGPIDVAHPQLPARFSRYFGVAGETPVLLPGDGYRRIGIVRAR